MEYPYITMLHKHKDQLIMEICDENKNYRVIIKKDNLFDGFIILSQPYKKTEKKKKDYYLFMIYTNIII